MTTYDLRLAGGEVYLHGTGVTQVDLLVTDGRIAGIVDRGAPAEAREVVQLGGKLVLPGAIDPHVHLGKDIRIPRDPDDARLETASAAAGGITSMLVYLMSGEGYENIVPGAQAVMEQDSYVDFGFHICVGTDDHVHDIPAYIRDFGVSSFKFFMNFKGEEGPTSASPATTTATCTTCSAWPPTPAR
ncbi:hypothetical protein [Nocardioides zeae]